VNVYHLRISFIGRVSCRLGLSSAGVGFKAFSVGDHDIWWAPFVRGISLLYGIHVEELVVFQIWI